MSFYNKDQLNVVSNFDKAIALANKPVYTPADQQELVSIFSQLGVVPKSKTTTYEGPSFS